jgi:hypothetical protein
MLSVSAPVRGFRGDGPLQIITPTSIRRASSPRLFVRPGEAGRPVRPFPPMGRAERLGEEPRPRRPHCCGQPACRWHTSGGPTRRRRSLSRTGPREAGLRLRSAREWTFRLAACPQELSLLPTRAWFVRTAARTCTWTVRPTRRRQSPRSPRLPDVPSVIREDLRPDTVADHRTPLPRHADVRDAPLLNGAGWR